MEVTLCAVALRSRFFGTLAMQLCALFFASKSQRPTKPMNVLSRKFNWGQLPCYSGCPLFRVDGKERQTNINQASQEVA
jgi:hypothetical protein